MATQSEEKQKKQSRGCCAFWGGGSSNDKSQNKNNQVIPNKKEATKDDENQSEVDDEEEDEVQDLEEIKKKVQGKSMRQSVSAEVYGDFNKKGEYNARVIEKNQDQIDRIKAKLSMSFMFSALDEKDMKTVIDSMEEKKYQVGDVIIQQGEDGNDLYVVDSGELDCFKKFSKDADDTFLKTYQPGEAFGELALLYNAPRAATVKAKSESTLFVVDRETFNHIVKDAAQKKRAKYEDFLAEVDILKSMDAYEKMTIADALKSSTCKAGELVFKQGDAGNDFYLLEEGQAVAIKDEGGEQKEVMQYQHGQYFGELALLNDEPRAASIKAVTDLKMVSLDRNSFKRLLGPAQEILKRNEESYKKYLNN